MMHCFTWTILAGLLALSSSAGLPQRPSSGYQEQDTARAFYSYGYSDDNAARAEYSSRDGTSRGFYSYVDAEGKLQTVRYEADGIQGFKAEASNQPQAPVDEGKAPLPVSDTEEVQQARLSHLNALREAREKALAASLREEADRRQQAQEQQQSRNNNNSEDQQSGEQSLTDEDAAILERVRAELSAMLADRQRSSNLPRNREDQEIRREQKQRQDQREDRRQDQREDRRQDQREDRRQDQREERRQDQREDRRPDQREDRRPDQREDRRPDQREDRRQDQREDRRPDQREDRRQDQREDRRQDQDQESRQDQSQNERQDQSSRNQEALRDLNNNRQLPISSDREADDLRLRTIYSLADLSSSSYLKLGDLASAEKLLEDRLDNSDLRVPIGAYYTLVSPNTKYSVTTPTELRTLRPVALSRSLLVSKRN
nr:repetin [Drosophila takahashii]